MSILEGIFEKKSTSWTYSPIAAQQAPAGNPPQQLLPDRCYLHVFLRSMKILNTRELWKNYYPTTHSHIELGDISGKTANFNTVTTPGNLQAIDAAHVDLIVNISQRLLGPVPYRGGGLKLEIGLFSIKEQDLLKPFVSLLSNLSTLGGVSFLSAALPYAKPLEDGISLLTNTADTRLEIGLNTEFKDLTTGYYVVMRKDVDEININEVHVSPNDYRLLDKHGKTIKDAPYMVLEIMASTTREDYYNIPEVAASYNSLRSLLATGKTDEAKAALENLKRVMYNSPELIFSDSKEIFKKISQQVSEQLESLSPTKVSINGQLESLTLPKQLFLPELSEVLEGVQHYEGYNGYQENFLGVKVARPDLNKYQGDITCLTGSASTVLNYLNYSVELSSSRKFPFYSASNINGAAFKKAERSDRWRRDTRIAFDSQYGGELYSADHSNFDRGHMTKREDVQWGDQIGIAERAADSTFFFTNAVPQHARLNQRIWRKLEDYILHTEAVKNGYKISVITGPVLRAEDPTFLTRVNQIAVKLPTLFYKIVYYLKDGKDLYRTGFLMSQKSLLEKNNIIETSQLEALESAIPPFMDFDKAATYQVTVATIEKLTGLTFASAAEMFQDDKPIELIEKQVDVLESMPQGLDFDYSFGIANITL
ncbi:DNA/RNA non-specific endonuclease [Pedobacter rhizosphaerae]|uniref:DNA/RNA endonuclease G, NUC1 n=1 Tax=Pedobacter rhizosphaerae TaxID=390241 RepID=A0A1H9T179_9SPHI|nr:DNA/RNA non-specific endonuclease [Pedobacter rhizosphaerae]SER90764.1 DNA/RNA endonuclease G, NUC1 [Pedobacter rhizosphaerae]